MLESAKVVVSAPTKIILFGEHSVVWGQPAIATAIDLRTYVSMEEAKGVSVEPQNLETYAIRFIWNQKKEKILAIPHAVITKRLMEFAKSTINVVTTEFGLKGAKVKISSNAPIAVGLGSSASLIVASLFAGAKLTGKNLPLSVLSEKAYKIEKEVQGYGSPTDTTLASFGGYFWIEGKKREQLDITHRLPIIVGNTGIQHRTMDLVERVKRSTDERKSIFMPIHESIGEISRKGRKILEKKELSLKDYKELGFLMNVNHGLLEALGVGSKETSLFVKASLQAGAWGAKITGAGGGGAIIVLTPSKKKEQIIAVLRNILGTYTPKQSAVYVDVCAQGVREETEQDLSQSPPETLEE